MKHKADKKKSAQTDKRQETDIDTQQKNTADKEANKRPLTLKQITVAKRVKKDLQISDKRTFPIFPPKIIIQTFLTNSC